MDLFFLQTWVKSLCLWYIYVAGGVYIFQMICLLGTTF